MLTRQAISPAPFIRRHSFIVCAIIALSLGGVIGTFSTFAPSREVHASPEYSFTGGAKNLTLADLGDITPAVGTWPIDAVPAIATPSFLVQSDLTVNGFVNLGLDDSHQARVDYDDPSTAGFDSVTVTTPREVVLDGNDWICNGESDLHDDGWHVRTRCKRSYR